MARILFGLLALAVVTTTAQAQLDLEVSQVNVVTGLQDLTYEGGTTAMFVGDDLEYLTLTQVRVVADISDSADLQISCTDPKTGWPVEYKQLTRTTLLFDKAGQYLFKADFIDWDKRTRGSKTIRLVVKTGRLGSSVDVSEPSEQLKRLLAPIATKLAIDPDKAEIVARMFPGFAAALRGKGVGPKITSLGMYEAITLASLRDLNMSRGVLIGEDIDTAIAEHLDIVKLDDGFEDRPLTEADRNAIADIYDAIAWIGAQ